MGAAAVSCDTTRSIRIPSDGIGPVPFDNQPVMMNTMSDEERELTQRWVETWRVAGVELEEIRRRELEAVDTREAIRQIFGSTDAFKDLPPRLTSGLVEQQA